MHHNYDESDSGYELDTDNKGKAFGGGGRGRIIFLGDGTEVLTGSDDTEMFDNADEDKDLESQVSKATPVEKESADAKSEVTTEPEAKTAETADEKDTTEESKE